VQCNKCKATWVFGPTDICPICRGIVRESAREAKRAPAELSQTKAWWERNPST
jgi:hypothetical protein